MQRIEVSFGLCDALNPGFGYQLKIANAENGNVLFNTTKGFDGKDLLTPQDCLDSVQMYLEVEAEEVVRVRENQLKEQLDAEESGDEHAWC